MSTSTQHLIRTAALVISGSLVAITAPVLVASSATAATQTVTITRSGFVPQNTTIKVGDTIGFTNTDAAAHQVLFKTTTGLSCTVTPLVVQPGTTQSCTWTAAGNYGYSDPNQRGKTFRGSVKVETVASMPPVATPSLSLAATATIVRYGNQTTLSGKTVPANAGTTIEIMAQARGEAAYAKVTSVATTNGGTYSVAMTPRIATSYRAEFQNGAARVASDITLVSVRPAVSLSLRTFKGGIANFTTKVVSGITYTGKYVLVQRKNSLGGWTTLKKATLDGMSTARFGIRVAKGTTRIRTLLTGAQAGAGYLSSTSRTITLTR